MTALEIKAILSANSTGQEPTPQNEWETLGGVCERAKQLPTPGDVVPGVIREGSSVNIQSVEKAGKSLLTMQIATEYCDGYTSSLVPHGEESSDVLPAKREAYIYDAELHDQDILERYEGLQNSTVKRIRKSFETPHDFLKHINSTLKLVTSNTLIVVDNITTICPNFSKKDVDELRIGLDKCKNALLAKGAWLTILFVHHTKTGTDGSNTNDRAGSVQWGRVADDNISLIVSSYGREYRELKNLNGRGKDALLKAGESLLIKKVDTHYPHFEYVRILSSEKSSSPKGVDSNAPEHVDAPHSWVLTEEEKALAVELYIPDQYGVGRIAKDMLLKRGLSTDSKSVGNMKSAVTRTLKQVGVYQQQKK